MKGLLEETLTTAEVDSTEDTTEVDMTAEIDTRLLVVEAERNPLKVGDASSRTCPRASAGRYDNLSPILSTIVILGPGSGVDVFGGSSPLVLLGAFWSCFLARVYWLAAQKAVDIPYVLPPAKARSMN